MKRDDLKRAGVRTHGMSEAPEYRAWRNMRARCNDPKHPAYAHYGGRGITVCAAWDASFEAFYAHMGPRPSPQHTLDRNDNNLGYSPGNCRWATRSQQCRNTRSNRLIAYDGRIMSLAEACELAGVTLNTAYQRAWSGKTDAEILSKSPLPQPKRGPRKR